MRKLARVEQLLPLHPAGKQFQPPRVEAAMEIAEKGERLLRQNLGLPGAGGRVDLNCCGLGRHADSSVGRNDLWENSP